MLPLWYKKTHKMKKKESHDIEKKEYPAHVSEPTSEYGAYSSSTSIPGCCSIDELHTILDRVEKNFSQGKKVCNEEALKRIMSW